MGVPPRAVLLPVHPRIPAGSPNGPNGFCVSQEEVARSITLGAGGRAGMELQIYGLVGIDLDGVVDRIQTRERCRTPIDWRRLTVSGETLNIRLDREIIECLRQNYGLRIYLRICDSVAVWAICVPTQPLHVFVRSLCNLHSRVRRVSYQNSLRHLSASAIAHG